MTGGNPDVSRINGQRDFSGIQPAYKARRTAEIAVRPAPSRFAGGYLRDSKQRHSAAQTTREFEVPQSFGYNQPVLKITAQDFHRRYAPSQCDLRIVLRERNVEESPPTEFEQVLMRLGQRFEAEHLATLANVVDVRSFDSETPAFLNSFRAGGIEFQMPGLEF